MSRLLRYVADTRGTALMVEVMVAMAILSLAVLPVFYALTATLIQADRSLLVTVATGLLQDRAEALKAAGFDLVPVGARTLSLYLDSTLDLVEEVVLVPAMDNNPYGAGAPMVKRIILTAYRHPYVEGADPLVRWEFLIYAVGF